jgi:hypothetical protein
MKNSPQMLNARVIQINRLLSVEEGHEDFVEVESQKPGNVRLYRLTTNEGSRNLSELDNLNATLAFADGMRAGIALWERKLRRQH